MKLAIWKWALCLALILNGSSGYAIIVDFQGIPAGTRVSAGNPYAGVLNLQATVTSVVNEPGFPAITTEATIENVNFTPDGTAVPAVAAEPINYPPSVVSASAELVATFSEPVFDVSFSAFCFRFASYTFSGFDSLGMPFTGSGIIPGAIDGPPPFPTFFESFDLTIPEGGYLTDFKITNQDPSPGDAAFWVNQISFTVVPEPQILTLLSVGLLGLLLPGIHRRVR